MKALAVGGMADHAHLLISLPATMSIARGIQLIKGGSSRWIHKTFSKKHAMFAWQEGYGAFSISISRVQATIDYINNQGAHHRHKNYQQEYRAFLDEHGIAYDERDVWG